MNEILAFVQSTDWVTKGSVELVWYEREQLECGFLLCYVENKMIRKCYFVFVVIVV